MPRATGGWWEEARSELLGLLVTAPEYWAAVWRKRRVAGLWDSERLYGAPGGCSEEEAIGELFGLKATAPEHRGAAWRTSGVGLLVSSGHTRAPGGCPEDLCCGSHGLRATQGDCT